jgi:hypothetical protein
VLFQEEDEVVRHVVACAGDGAVMVFQALNINPFGSKADLIQVT